MQKGSLFLAAGAVLALSFSVSAPETTRVLRDADGHPDLRGIWQALNTANWDLEDHSAHAGTMWETGAIGAEPAGLGVVEGGAIPYLPAARETKNANLANRRTNDPEAKCYMPGIPRANYMPYPFQIVQSPKGILFVYESRARIALLAWASRLRPWRTVGWAPTTGTGRETRWWWT